MNFGAEQKRWGPAMVENLCRGPIVAVVEADSHMRHALWELTGETPPHPAQARLGLRPLSWEGSGSGTFAGIGSISHEGAQLPVNVDLMVQKIEGQWVAFAFPCSLAVDRAMCDAFLDAAFPNIPRFKPSQWAGFCDLLAAPAPRGPKP